VQEPVDGRGGEGLGHDGVEAIRGWHMFVLADLPCSLRIWGSFSFPGSLRRRGLMLGGTLIVQV
jgi:hypothetical protein